MCIWITYGIPNVSQSEEEGMRQSDSFNNRSVLAMNMGGSARQRHDLGQRESLLKYQEAVRAQKNTFLQV